jgi:hypothetical protein
MNFFTKYYKKLADTSHLTEQQLRNRMRLTRGLALFSAACALGWGLFGIAGLVALGLKAAGYNLLPAALGASSMISGAGFAVKSFISNRILTAIYRKFEREQKHRDEANSPAAPLTADEKPAAPTLASRLKGLGKSFNIFASRKTTAANKPKPVIARPLKPSTP